MEKFKIYLFSYEYEGACWVLEIKANSPEDAKRRIKNLNNASYDGELLTKVELPNSFSRLWNLLVVFFRRLFND